MDPDSLFGPLDGGRDDFGSQYLELLGGEGWSADSKPGNSGERKRSWEVVFEAGADSGNAGGGGGGGKSVKDAKNKASREKARRERINERFNELAKLCDPDDPKGDKSSILLDAIRVVKQQRVEMDQLKQLNKFIEERVGQYEKERSQLLYRQNMLLQQPVQARGSMTSPFLPHEFPNTVGSVVPNHGTGGKSLPPSGNLSCIPQSGTAMGIPIGDCRPQLFPNAISGEEACGWVPTSRGDNSKDHLLRPPAA